MNYGFDRELGDLQRGLVELNLSPSPRVMELFRLYLEMLERFRGHLHLLSRLDHERLARRHFLPSLLALEYTAEHCRAADLGAGAGFPSLPVKIMVPGLDLTLIESVGKKARFLNMLVDALNLPTVEIFPGRAENYPGVPFDLLLLKAVGSIRDWLAVINQLLRPSGRAVFFKNPRRAILEVAAARPQLERMGFSCQLQLRQTPLEHLPLTLVELTKLTS